MNFKKNLKLFSIGVLFFVMIGSYAFAAEYNYKLSDVYNAKRINAYRNAIRYYNSSISNATAERIARAIVFYSHQHKIEDDRFVAAVITIESMFNPNAVSRSGAMGLGQLMPGTAQSLSVNNPFSIEQNVSGACRYLKAQLVRFKKYPRQQQYEYTLAAYNAGPGAVERWGGIPPYAETQAYVGDVINVWRQFCGLGKYNESMRNRGAAARNKSLASSNANKKPKSSVKITRKYIITTIDENGVEKNL